MVRADFGVSRQAVFRERPEGDYGNGASGKDLNQHSSEYFLCRGSCQEVS